jgi:hypothetical protein
MMRARRREKRVVSPAAAAKGTSVATIEGLSSSEVAARRKRGEANTPPTTASRTYAAILRTNVFSFFNVILFVIGVALLALGRYGDAVISVGLGLVRRVGSAATKGVGSPWTGVALPPSAGLIMRLPSLLPIHPIPQRRAPRIRPLAVTSLPAGRR